MIMTTKSIKSTKILFISIIMGLFTFQSCSNSDSLISEENSHVDVLSENLKDITASDMETMIDILKESGVDSDMLDNIDIYASEPSSLRSTPSVMNILVRTMKVTTKIKHPDGSGKDITVSGVLLVPRISFSPLRILVGSPPTYLNNSEAPTNMFKSLSLIRDNGEINYLYFFTLQATQGFAVLFPDYPGYGDSYGEGVMPFACKEPLVNSTIELVKAAQEILKKNKYSYKKELILTGYSLGAYVATSLYQKLENDANMPVKLTIAGGSLLDFSAIFDRARSSDTFADPLTFPFVLLAYSKYEDKSLVIKDMLKSPYCDMPYLEKAFDGTNSTSKINDMFPSKVSDLFTDIVLNEFNTNPKLNSIRHLLDKNCIKPWKNKHIIEFIHGMNDNTSYYDITKNFYEEQKKLGGDVKFTPVIGDHMTAALGYYLYTSVLLLSNK